MALERNIEIIDLPTGKEEFSVVQLFLDQRPVMVCGYAYHSEILENYLRSQKIHPEKITIKNMLNERYTVVLQVLKDHSVAIEQMTAELLEIEVISGERVREIITENGGTVFVGEDLHSEEVKESKESVITEENTQN